MATSFRVVALLSLVMAIVGDADGKKRGGGKKRGWFEARSRELREGRNALGAWRSASQPLHTTRCGDRVCRPGEGNLKGYGHWVQPYEHTDVKLSEYGKTAPGWEAHSAFPSARYTNLIQLARERLRDGFVILTAADFDFRFMALNWYRAATRIGVANGLVHALDTEAYAFLRDRGVPTNDGSIALNAWNSTRLRRHLQRALAERHMAAAALVDAGINVLLMDSSAVLLRPVAPYFTSVAAMALDVMAMRANCDATKEPALGCNLLWNFLFLRGAPPARPPAPRDTRVLDYVQSAIERGLVDFYLRWWRSVWHYHPHPRCVRVPLLPCICHVSP